MEALETDTLQDGFKTVNAWVCCLVSGASIADTIIHSLTAWKVTNGVSWLDDIQQFYRERSVIEKEYSAKLNALAKKYYEKKIKRSSSLSVGDTPTQTPGSLERYINSQPVQEAPHSRMLHAVPP